MDSISVRRRCFRTLPSLSLSVTHTHTHTHSACSGFWEKTETRNTRVWTDRDEFLMVVQGKFGSCCLLKRTNKRRKGSERAAACEEAITKPHLLTCPLTLAQEMPVFMPMTHGANGRNEPIMLHRSSDTSHSWAAAPESKQDNVAEYEKALQRHGCLLPGFPLFKVRFGEAADQDSQELFGLICQFVHDFRRAHAELRSGLNGVHHSSWTLARAVYAAALMLLWRHLVLKQRRKQEINVLKMMPLLLL